MDPLFFVLQNQLTNLTPFLVDFDVADRPRRRVLPKLAPGKTRFVKQAPVLRWIKNWKPAGWIIRVKLDGKFTGIELDPTLMKYYVRIVFRFESNVLYVDGVKEVVGWKDAVLRLRFFGCMRNYSWDHRKPIQLYRSNSELATKSRIASPRNESHTVQIQPARTTMGHPHPPRALERSEDQSGPSNIRPLSPPVRSGEQKRPDAQARSRDDESPPEPPKPPSSLQNRLITDYYLPRLRDDESPPEPPKPSSSLQNRRITDCYLPRLRDDESPPESSKPSSSLQNRRITDCYLPRLRDDESVVTTTKPAMPSRQQARVRDDDESLTSPQVRVGEQLFRPLELFMDQSSDMAEREIARMDLFVALLLLLLLSRWLSY